MWSYVIRTQYYYIELTIDLLSEHIFNEFHLVSNESFTVHQIFLKFVVQYF